MRKSIDQLLLASRPAAQKSNPAFVARVMFAVRSTATIESFAAEKRITNTATKNVFGSGALQAWSNLIGVIFKMNKKQSFLVVPLVVAALVAGVVVFQANSPVSAHELAVAAAERVQQMSPQEIAQINSQYNQDIAQRLDEAQKSGSLHTISLEDLQDLPGSLSSKHNSAIKKYLEYTNSAGERIVVALGEDNRPLYVMNVDAAPTLPAGASQPDVQVR